MTIESFCPSIHAALSGSDQPSNDDIDDDMAGEQETLPELTEADKIEPPLTESTISKWCNRIAGACKGVTDGTGTEYEQ